MVQYIYDNLADGESYYVDELVDQHPEVILDCMDNGRIDRAEGKIEVSEHYLDDITSFNYSESSDYVRKFEDGTDWLMDVLTSLPPMTIAEKSGIRRVDNNFEINEAKVDKDLSKTLAERNNTASKIGKYSTGIGAITAYFSSDPWVSTGGIAGLLSGPMIYSHCKGRSDQYERKAIEGWDSYTRGEFRNWRIEKE